MFSEDSGDFVYEQVFLIYAVCQPYLSNARIDSIHIASEERHHRMNTLDEIAKILAITAGLLGSLITSQMAQGYDFSDMQRMGMSGSEARTAMQMSPQDRAALINSQIESIGGEDLHSARNGDSNAD